MTAALPYRPWLTAPLAFGGALLFGAAVARQPALAAGLVGLGLVALLAFAAPVAHLWILIVLTAIVPYELQNRFGIGGGAGSAGLLLSDVFLITGLARASWALSRRPPEGIRMVVSGLLVVFLGLAAIQLVRGVVQFGRAPSEVGAEFRVLLGFGAALIALPLLEEKAARDRLARGFAAFALLLGAWGLTQWIVDIPFAEAGDVGVREGVSFTTAGRGQVQGGLYAFAPVSVILFAVLVSGAVRTTRARALLIGALALNLASLILTYERTFWVATLLGFGIVIVRAGGTRRLKALVATPLALTAFLALMATVAPATLGAARERLMSIGQYGNDKSLRYRIVESRHVVEQIERRPLLGSAPGATILWGRPWEDVKPRLTHYAHNGYLWLAWKLGIPLALLLLALLLAGVLRRPPRGDSREAALAGGAQAGLAVLLLASATFPSFSALAISALMGVMLALALARRSRSSSPGSTPARP